MPTIIKELMLKEIRKEFESEPYAVISAFEGVAVADLSMFRRNLEKSAKRSLVVKHSLVRKVFEDFKFDGADKLLKGNVLVSFGDKDPQVMSKAVMDLAKENKKIIPMGMIFEKKVYGEAFVKRLAQLPSRKELLTQALIRMKSPVSGLVLTLNQLVRGMVVVLGELKKKKEGAA